MDSKQNLNMGSSRPTSVFVALDSVLDRINNKMNLVLMRGNQFVNNLSSGISKLSASTGEVSTGAPSQNVVMSQPPVPFTIPWQAAGQESTNRVMTNPAPLAGGEGGGAGAPPSTPSGGGALGNYGFNWGEIKNKVANFGSSDFGSYIRENKLALGMTAGAFAFAATPETREGVYLNYMTNRSRFYGASAPGGPAVPDRPGSSRTPGFLPGFMRNQEEEQYNAVSLLQRQLSTAGTVTNKFDVVEAMSSAQAYGLGVANPGYRNTMTGVMQMTNLMPGVTGAEAARGFMTGMQNPRSVNMMRFIGIEARDPVTGAMRSPTEIANQLWEKINREKIGGSRLTERDLAISLQPGNALDSMLNMYFGQDPVARKFVEDALYAKVKGATDFSSKEMQRIGATTQAVRDRSERNTRALQTSQQTARAQAGAQSAADTVIAFESALLNAIDRLTGALSGITYAKGFGETFGGAANGTQGKFMSFIASLFGFGGGIFKAEGGPVEKRNAYIVGEEGPELFVPDASGTIVPNHELQFKGFRKDGGKVTPKDFAMDLAQGLGVKDPSKEAIDALVTWMRFEGGHWKNSADFNPLNTTLTRPGSKSMNPIGVKAYTSWDQGLQATIDTLTGNKAKERGYTAIIDALKGGDKDDILQAINNSAWRTGKAGGAGTYKGMASSSGGNYGNSTDRKPGSSSFSSSSNSNAGAVAPGGITTVKDFLKEYAPQALQQQGNAAGVNNYVNIRIDGAKSPKDIAKEVKKILDDSTGNAGKS